MPIVRDRSSPLPAVRSLRWWQCLLAGVLFGLALIFAFPPGGFALAGPLAIVPLVLVAARVGTAGPSGRLRRAALLVGLGALPSWAYLHAFIIDITAPGYPLLCLYLSAYPAVFVLLLGLWMRRIGPRAIGRRVPVALVAATLWVGMEMLRGEWMLGGYPWYFIGHPLIDFWPIAIAASGFGAIGVSLMAAMPAGLVAEHFCPGPVSRRIGSWAVAGLVCVGMPITGAMTRTPIDPATQTTGTPATFRVGVIQTDVPQSNKGSGTGADRVERMRRWLDMTRLAAEPDAQGQRPGQPPGQRPGVILWPETMFPATALNPEAVRVARENDLAYPLADGRRVGVHEFAELLTREQAKIGVPMIVGAIAIDGWTITVRPDGSIDDSFDGKFNSAMLIRGGQVEQTRYDKRRLAPFGETLPLVGAFPTLKRWIMAVGARGMTFELSEGTKNTRFELAANTPATAPAAAPATAPVVRVAAPICFEIAYPESCRSLAYERGQHAADLLINLSNDGWFGAYAVGRPGHMLLCRWRCVELGLPMVRSVNTGISGVIDARGRIIRTVVPMPAPTPARPGPDFTPQESFFVHDVPLNENARTLFGIIGDVTGWICVGLAAVWCVLLMVLRSSAVAERAPGG